MISEQLLKEAALSQWLAYCELKEVNQELVEALEECVDELTDLISEKYPEVDRIFPCIQKDFEMDMIVVKKARAVIDKARGKH